MQLFNRAHLALLAAAGIAQAQSYANNSRSHVPDNPLVAAAFPDVDIELLSPAFLNPETIPAGFAENTAGPTDQATLESFLKNLAKDHDWITYNNSAHLRSEEGRSLPYVKLSTTTLNSTSSNKLRLYFQGGVHGDEPGGDQSLLALLGKFAANETWALSVLDKIDLLILPRFNPDGVAYFQRQLASGFDGNRHHATLQRKQVNDVRKLIVDFDPHIGLDAHEYTGVFPVGSDGNLIRSQDVLVSAVKNPNIHADIRALGEGLFTETVFDTVKAAGFRTGPYFTTGTSGGNIRLTEPSSVSSAGHNSWGLGQAVTFLTETRGIRLGDQHFHRRVTAGLTAIEAIVQIAVNNANLVYDTIENARREFIESKDDIIVVDEARVTETTIEFINADDGSIVDVPVQFNNNTPSEVVLTRPRPEAYVFSSAHYDVAEKLRILGVEVEVVEDQWTGTVETLTAATVELEDSIYEGVVRSRVTTTSGSREVTFPPGSFRVNTKQQHAAAAFVLLEPENRASFVVHHIVPLVEGEEYPVFRVL